VSPGDLANPYVGPRALRTGEDLPARSQEVRDLTDLLIAERITLLHAPSGAGKTSLIQAGVIPLLEREGEFQNERPFRPTPALRVKTPPRPGLKVRNRYTHSIALELLPGRDEAEVATMALDEVIAEAMPWRADHTPVLILDQFEEVLVLDPTDWRNQDVFFAELGRVLRTNDIWLLVAMREDYMGGLDRYLHHIPGYLQTTFRLDFLDTEAAKVAIRQPAAKRGVEFTDDAAGELVKQLCTIRVQSPGDGVGMVEGPYVQPFQLQVVCRSLWRSLQREKHAQLRTIDLTRVRRHADVAESLRRYYRDTLTDVASDTGMDELALRDWIENCLVTAQGFRSQTMVRPASDTADTKAVVGALQNAYLLRSDTRSGSIWYELAHDQLIAPILEDNTAWREARLESWQQRARDWHATRQRDLLLVDTELRYAQRRAHVLTVTPAEQEFLAESATAERDRSVTERMRSSMGRLRLLVAVLGLIVVILIVLLIVTWD
jgi:hypothetical protein